MACAGAVTGRTFRRDHFLLDVQLAEGDELRISVPLGIDAPEIGDAVHVALRPGASTVPLAADHG